MGGRHGRSALDGQGDPQAALEEEAAHTSRVIAGLLLRLQQCPELLEHAKVLSAWCNLEEYVASQRAYADEYPARHRSPLGGVIGEHVSDASGDDLKPNPDAVTTVAEFIEVLWQYRAWSGDPSWRAMAERAGQIVVFSTMYNAMQGTVLPRLHVVRAIIIGCGGGEDDVHSFSNAWRRIRWTRPTTGPIYRPSDE
jgi:hypothetical protein